MKRIKSQQRAKNVHGKKCMFVAVSSSPRVQLFIISPSLNFIISDCSILVQLASSSRLLFLRCIGRFIHYLMILDNYVAWHGITGHYNEKCWTRHKNERKKELHCSSVGCPRNDYDDGTNTSSRGLLRRAKRFPKTRREKCAGSEC